MPPTGFDPMAARYSFAYLPLIHSGIVPLRAWRSANRIDESLPSRTMSIRLKRSPTRICDESCVGPVLTYFGIPQMPLLEKPVLLPLAIHPFDPGSPPARGNRVRSHRGSWQRSARNNTCRNLPTGS